MDFVMKSDYFDFTLISAKFMKFRNYQSSYIIYKFSSEFVKISKNC